MSKEKVYYHPPKIEELQRPALGLPPEEEREYLFEDQSDKPLSTRINYNSLSDELLRQLEDFHHPPSLVTRIGRDITTNTGQNLIVNGAFIAGFAFTDNPLCLYGLVFNLGYEIYKTIKEHLP